MYKSIFLLAIIITSLGAVVGTSMYVPDPSNDEVPIASLFPWNQTIYFYTKLLGQGGFMNITDIMHIILPSEFNNNLNGGFEATFNESMLFLKFDVNGSVEYINETYNFTGISISGTIDGSINGSSEKIYGNLDAKGEIELGTGNDVIQITYDLPMVFGAKYEKNIDTITISFNTNNGYVKILGERVDLSFYRIQYFNMKKNETRTKVGFTATCANQQILMMVASMVSRYLNVAIQPPVFDPATGKFKISHYEDKTMKYEFPKEFKEYFEYKITSINGEIHLVYSIEGDEPRLLATINGYGYLKVEGDFKKGFRLDDEGFTNIKSMKAKGTIKANGTEVEVILTVYAEYSTINPYLVQFTYRNIVFSMLEAATNQSKAVIEATDGVKLYLNGQVYDKLVFTKENATLTKDLRIVVNGTILESEHVYGKVLLYRMIEKTDKVHVYVFRNDTKTITVEAPYANSVVVSALNTTLDGKEIKAVFDTDREVIVKFPETAKGIKGEVKVELLPSLPKPLPTNVINVSTTYDVTFNTTDQVKVQVSLKYDPSKVPSGSNIYVAHYANGQWELLTPNAIDYQNGYANITLTSLSPLVVVANTSVITTTPTTTTTTTTTPTTTTTTTQIPTTTTTTATTTTTTPPTTTTTTTEVTTTTTTTSPTTTTTTTTTTTQIPATTTTTTTTPEQEMPITVITLIIITVIAVVGGALFLLKKK